jgi:murein DD-endopeptidase
MSIQAFLGYVSLQDGAPYVWGGKETHVFVDGALHRHAFGFNVFDCSGLVTCGIKAAGGKDMRASHSANVMWAEWDEVEKPEAGDLVFYGMGSTATHVEVVMPDGRYFGALNGSRHTVIPNPEKARVRYRLTARPDLIGFRRNPLR